MERVLLTHENINKYYVDLDSDCLAQIHSELDIQDLYLVIDEEGYADIVTKAGTHLSLPTDYFVEDTNEKLEQILLEHYFKEN